MINNNFLQEGISPSYFFQYVDTLTNLNLHSLVIYKDNKLLSKIHIVPYNEHEKQILFSVSKSFTAIAMMFALQDKLFTLDTTIYSLLKHKLNFEPTEDIKSITIHHLLSMTYGFIDKEIQDFYLKDDWISEAFSLKLQTKPGTSFFYNNRCPFLCSAIIQELTGKNLLTYLQEKLFSHLNITNISWEKNTQNYDKGSWGLSLTTEDLAKFGQFILNKGSWNNKQLLASEYIEKLLTVYINTDDKAFPDSKLGYGYYFWKCQPEKAFRCAGLFGQYCIILPKENMVIAITSNAENEQKQAILSATWKFLDQIKKDNKSSTQDLSSLNNYLSKLHLPYLPNDNSITPEIFQQEFKFSHNPLNLNSISFSQIAPDCIRINITLSTKKYNLLAKLNAWQKNNTNSENDNFDSCTTIFYENPYANYGWQNNKLNLKLVYNQGIFIDTLEFNYYNHQLYLHYNPTPSFIIRTKPHYLISNPIK